LKRTTEDYLKTIYLLEKKYRGVRGVEIAEELNVSRPTVSIILKRLIEEGYVTKNKEHEVFLTDAGREIAENTARKNQMFKELLIELGVDEQTAAADACEMEHAVSAASFEALRLLIPRKNGGEVL
jgi:Mn-dependent DtxR family transcriptional regulator